MLVGLLNFLFSVVIFLVEVASWVLLAYVVLSLILPQNKYTLMVGKYIEPVLTPIRAWLQKTFPALANLRFDLSPLVLWLLMDVAVWLLKLLKGLLL